MLYGYRQPHCLCKNRIYLQRHCDVEKRFDASNYKIDRPLPLGKNKKIIRLMKDELGGQIGTEFVGLRAESYS